MIPDFTGNIPILIHCPYYHILYIVFFVHPKVYWICVNYTLENIIKYGIHAAWGCEKHSFIGNFKRIFGVDKCDFLSNKYQASIDHI